MGSHDRAVRVAGRSAAWNNLADLEQINVIIISNLTSCEKADIIEKQQIQIFDKAVNTQHSFDRGHCFDPILQFSRDGELRAKYLSATDAQLLGFSNGCIRACCDGTRGLHKNFIWMYQSDYNKFGFRHTVKPNEVKLIQQVSLDGQVIRELSPASAFNQFGFTTKNVQQVCTGQKKSHGGFRFKYVEN
jgi:hypothetical protein